MRLSSVMYRGMFDTVEIVVADKIQYKSSMKGNTDLEKSILPFMNNQDFLSSAVSFRSQMYKSGDIVVLETYNPDEHKVGLILTILIRGDSVFFIVKQYVAIRSWLRFFKSSSDDPVLSIFDARNFISTFLLLAPPH